MRSLWRLAALTRALLVREEIPTARTAHISATLKATSSSCTETGLTRLDHRALPLTGPLGFSDSAAAAQPLNPNSVAPAALRRRHPLRCRSMGGPRPYKTINKTAGLTRQSVHRTMMMSAWPTAVSFKIKSLDAEAIALFISNSVSRRFLSLRRIRACDGLGTCRQSRRFCHETPPRPRHRWR